MKKWIIMPLMVCVMSLSAFAFDSGFTLGVRANLAGSLTDPHISKEDRNYLGAEFMRGMLGFVVSGDVELTYIFDSKRYFNYTDNNIFGGLGWAFNLGIGQGFSGQISGSTNERIGKIDVYCRVFMSPVLNFSTSLKTYFLKNRLALSFTVGGKMPMDPDPTYELYSNLTKKQLEDCEAEGLDFYPETGTLVVSEKMMKKINPIGALLKLGVEYNQPVIETMELTFGAFLQYYIYRPKYVIMPKKVVDAAVLNGQKNGITIDFENHPINSFYMNSFDFGLIVGLLFKV